MRFYMVNFHYANSYTQTITNMPLGAGYVLEAVEKQGIPTRYWEYSVKPQIHQLLADIKAFAPSLIGCSFYSHHYKTTYDIIRRISELGIPIVCGGVHVNTLGAVVLEETAATFLIKGEGEESLIMLLKHLDRPGELNGKNSEKNSDIPGLVYRENGAIRENPRKPLELSTVSYPRYQAFDIDAYPHKARLILSSRGCPYSCTFCTMSALLSKNWRSHTPQQIIEELEYWAARGVTDFNFCDDNLTLDNQRMKTLCQLIQKSPYRYQLSTSGVRISNVTYELLEMMRDTGFDYFSFGIESGNDRVLKEIRKGITLKQIHRTLDMVCRLNYHVKLYFIINNRTETYQEVRDSFDLARHYPIQSARFSNLVPYPGTYDFQWIREHGRLLYEPGDYLNRLDQFRTQPLYDGPGMSLEERVQVINEAQSELRRFEPGWGHKVKTGLRMLGCGEFAPFIAALKRRLTKTDSK